MVQAEKGTGKLADAEIDLDRSRSCKTQGRYEQTGGTVDPPAATYRIRNKTPEHAGTRRRCLLFLKQKPEKMKRKEYSYLLAGFLRAEATSHPRKPGEKNINYIYISPSVA